ncbi:MAG: hypothetical protein KC493_11790 [Bacteriovoracaceae bacterium]|nr:hypothetical protein [Bacteriovoracaceae bacterium]
MKKLLAYLSVYLLIFNSAYAGQKKIQFKDYLIDHYARYFHNNFSDSISNWNKNADTPKKLLKLVSKKDRSFIEKGLIESGIKKMPKFTRTGKIWSLKAGSATLKFKITDVFDGYAWVNGKKVNLEPSKSASERAKSLAKVLRTKTSHFPIPLINDAHALIPCGGLCWGILIGATVVAGAALIGNLRANRSERDYRMLSKMRDEIKQSALSCEEEHLKVSVYSTNLHSYKTTAPGNYKTFKVLRKILKEQVDPDLSDIKKHLYKSFGREFSTCKGFAKELHGNAPLSESSTTFLSTIEEEVCRDYEKLSECLDEFVEVHNSHQGKRNNNSIKYNEQLGVYGDESPIGLGTEQ